MRELLIQLIIRMIIHHPQTRLPIFPYQSRSYPRTHFWANMKPDFAQAGIAPAGAMHKHTSGEDSIGGCHSEPPALVT